LRNTLVVVAATENGMAETNSREHPIHTRDGPLTISCFTLLVGLLNQAQYTRSYQGGPISDSRAQSGCHAPGPAGVAIAMVTVWPCRRTRTHVRLLGEHMQERTIQQKQTLSRAFMSACRCLLPAAGHL